MTCLNHWLNHISGQEHFARELNIRQQVLQMVR